SLPRHRLVSQTALACRRSALRIWHTRPNRAGHQGAFQEFGWDRITAWTFSRLTPKLLSIPKNESDAIVFAHVHSPMHLQYSLCPIMRCVAIGASGLSETKIDPLLQP